MKTNYRSNNINHNNSFFRTNNRTASGCFSEQNLTAHLIPGIAVAIIKDGKVVLAKGMG
jgi:CubicO group peptidase (beta-lactamase class C family)